MLPVRANANVIIKKNKPSDAREVLLITIENNTALTLCFMALSTLKFFAGLDKDNPYLDKVLTMRETIKLENMRLNNFKNAVQNSDDNHKTILPRMWSTDHIANYMNLQMLLSLNTLIILMKRISLNTELTPVNQPRGLQQSYWTIKMKSENSRNSELLTHKKQIDNDGYVKFQKLW
jgi:hypothetical protein